MAKTNGLPEAMLYDSAMVYCGRAIRVAEITPVNILATARNPAKERRDALRDRRFEFRGYDVVGFGMSALINCGGLPLAFCSEELSASGLIFTLARAKEIQAALRESYPDGGHTDCDIWALWKKKEPLHG
jgi:hypothetical protein